jgi:hypothetical protein
MPRATSAPSASTAPAVVGGGVFGEGRLGPLMEMATPHPQASVEVDGHGDAPLSRAFGTEEDDDGTIGKVEVGAAPRFVEGSP